MTKDEWYVQINRHPAVRVFRSGIDRGTCAGCRYTGVPGEGGYGMEGVSGYWCRQHQVPVNGDRTCNNFVKDR